MIAYQWLEHQQGCKLLFRRAAWLARQPDCQAMAKLSFVQPSQSKACKHRADVLLQTRQHVIDGKKVEAKAAVPRNSGSGNSLTKKMFVGGTVSDSHPRAGRIKHIPGQQSFPIQVCAASCDFVITSDIDNGCGKATLVQAFLHW